MTTTVVRVVVVDDHPVFRLGLVALIDGLENMEVVAEAASAKEALDAVREHDPDVVVMDVELGAVSGIEATRSVLAASPSTGVLVLTMFGDDDSVHAAIRAGARGYLVKGARPAEIDRAIRAVANGDVILGAAAAARLAQLQWRSTSARPFPELSEREREVLDLVARGLDNRAIARRLVLSDKTIRNHVSNIFTKLGVGSRGEAIARARDAGVGGAV
jgi:DNA-binding NarL/FixJ family response regulator